MLGETEENIEKEMKPMEEEKVIAGYHTMINWDKTDDEKVTALIEVKVIPLGWGKAVRGLLKNKYLKGWMLS